MGAAPADEDEEWEWQLAVARARAAAQAEEDKAWETPTPVAPSSYRPTTFAHAPARQAPHPHVRRFPRASAQRAVAPLPWLPKPRPG